MTNGRQKNDESFDEMNKRVSKSEQKFSENNDCQQRK